MPTSSSLSIGDLALQADCKVQTIRYYEDIGLLPPPLRNAGNQRRYGDTTLGRLNFIRHARDFGFPVPAIRELLSLSDTPERPCEEIHAVARHHLDEVEARLQRLEALREELQRMLSHGDDGQVRDCRVIEVLSDHKQCEVHGRATAENTHEHSERPAS
ncbi:MULTISPECIES: MerR family transcriptional regulator [unclassified Cobetia]|uniref:MerR family transcriptional regulator n=1 Tax=unclassified Cobetia TaxID=2609414 RepID=UPI000B53F51C|nr:MULTISPECIES: helix-turn-helix domain-containing protein [unclassified Cobetia]